MAKIVHAIDGNNFANRAFYAGNTRLSHNGIPTNAVHMFFNMLNSEMEIQNIKRLAFAFDIPTHKTWRYKEIQQRMKKGLSDKAYKSDRKKNRDPKVEESKKLQIEYIRKLLTALGWPVFLGTKTGDEADDIVGAVAVNGIKAPKKHAYKTMVHSNDKDFAQLLDVHCRITKPKMDCPVTHKNCKIVYGVEPYQVVDFLAMMGDGVDSIQGIPGCGDKTALVLLEEYGTFDEILANIDSLKGREGGVIRRANDNLDLVAHMEFMRRMIRLRTDLPYVPKRAKDFKQGKVNEKAVAKLVKKLGLKKTAILRDYA